MKLTKEAQEIIESKHIYDTPAYTKQEQNGMRIALTWDRFLKAQNLYTSEEVKELKEQNEYLKAEFNANIDKVYTLSELNQARSEGAELGWDKSWEQAIQEKGSNLLNKQTFLNSLPQADSGWVNVEDGLPKGHSDVWVFVPELENYVGKGWYRHHEKQWDTIYANITVTHWKPITLPLPPPNS